MLKMTNPITAAWFAEKIGDRSLRGIALETSALIRSGILPVGSRLPSIRDIAYEMGISPATISQAWRELRRRKILIGRGRNGTWVSGDRFVTKPERLASSGHYGDNVIDLTRAAPDPALLPSLAEALAHSVNASGLNQYERSHILPELEGVVREQWPYQPEAFLAMNGGYNAIYTLLHALVMPGAGVAIEHPTAMRLLDILEDLGVRILPVMCDDEGPLPASLAQIMRSRPTAFLFQPRLHSVTAQTLGSHRLSALGDVLEDSDTLIIEDDGIGDVSSSRQQSLGARFPDRTIHILSYSKTLGPDLRLAVLSSTETIVDQIRSYRSFSSGWTSRILQCALSYLLRKPTTSMIISEARRHYRERRETLLKALQKRHLLLPNRPDGLCLWIPVESEQFAMVTLAARDIAVEPGSKFSIEPVNRIRVATSCLSLPCEEIADAIAIACRRRW